MVAFSCCVFDGGDNEKKELDAAREKGWKGKFTRPGRVIRPGAIRMNGKCPLTPLEVCQYLKDDVSAWKEASGTLSSSNITGDPEPLHAYICDV